MSAPPFPFKKTCPCIIFSPRFFNFSDPHSLRGSEVIKTYFRRNFKKGGGGGGGLNYVSLHTSWLISVIIRKKTSVVNSDLELLALMYIMCPSAWVATKYIYIYLLLSYIYIYYIYYLSYIYIYYIYYLSYIYIYIYIYYFYWIIFQNTLIPSSD